MLHESVTGYLYYPTLESWTPIPPSQRLSPSVIKSIGDDYFNRFDNISVTVPWGPPCTRVEGGTLITGTLTGDNCTTQFPDTVVISNRRYVVDEVLGSVSIFDSFPGLDVTQPNRSVPDSHLFRVEEGKIKYIHAVTHCFAFNCGQNFTG
jgi:hypothetical protein